MKFKSAVFGAVLSLATSVAGASTLVVSHDEWTLSDSGFAAAPTTANLVSNLVSEFGTKIHAWSTNFGLTGSSLASAMAGAGATFTSGTGFSFNLTNISAYDAIMLGGDYLSATELGDLGTYITNGGNVYIMGGTGAGGPVLEANAWNSFLAAYGVQMATSYNGVAGVGAVAGDPIFSGVAGLFSNNGNSLSGSSVVCCGQTGLYAVWRSDGGPPVEVIPVPAAGVLLLCGLGGLAALRLRKTS
jgi:hypothetical protein